MTRCANCGGPVKTRREKSYRYAESGLPDMVLVDAATITTCEQCGETYIGIQAVGELHRQIARALLLKKGRLAGEEIRFLRKSLGWSGVDFAKKMGAQPETVSRWENNRTPMGPQADRLLRLLVATSTPIMDYSVDVLEQIAADDGPDKPVRVELEQRPKGWTFRSNPALVSANVPPEEVVPPRAEVAAGSSRRRRRRGSDPWGRRRSRRAAKI